MVKNMYLGIHKSKANGMVAIGCKVGGTEEDDNREKKFQSDKDKFKNYIKQDSDYNNNI